MKAADVLKGSVLVATMEGNPEVQLRQQAGWWWMLSPKTGVHCIVSETFSDRVQAHWAGFKANQSR